MAKENVSETVLEILSQMDPENGRLFLEAIARNVQSELDKQEAEAERGENRVEADLQSEIDVNASRLAKTIYGDYSPDAHKALKSAVLAKQERDQAKAEKARADRLAAERLEKQPQVDALTAELEALLSQGSPDMRKVKALKAKLQGLV